MKRSVRGILAALAFLLPLAGGCRKREPEQEQPGPATERSAASEASTLVVQRREAHAHAHLLIEQRPPALELRLVRPKVEDRSILLCVAGTYTSPEGRPEGLVAIAGTIVERQPKPWEGLLIVQDGAPTLLRAEKQQLEGEPLRQLIGTRGSLIQGHLLVDGSVQRLKASPSLRRRALATRADGSFFLVESLVPLPLSDFAADLIELGARRALNLDMGEWSEGFYRDPLTGEVRVLGDDHRRTSQQTNWLVLVKPPR